MGTPDFAVRVLDEIMSSGIEVAAVVTTPDRKSGRGLKVTPSAVKTYAEAHSLPVLQPERLRDEAFLSALRSFDASLFVVVAFRMLPQLVWDMPRLGTINLHASLLPQYRGAAPINWAIINGERQTGVTTFRLNERIDEGEILLQQASTIAPDETAGTLHDRLADMGAALTVETVRQLFAGTAMAQKQPDSATLRPAPKIFKPDCAIDWTADGMAIERKIRGLSPYPAATARLSDGNGKVLGLKIYDARFVPETTSVPLSCVHTDGKNSLKISVNGGFIEILRLQIDGKKQISVLEFLRGYNVSNWYAMN